MVSGMFVISSDHSREIEALVVNGVTNSVTEDFTVLVRVVSDPENKSKNTCRLLT